ncbi:hypothetical protein T492DRAFT_966530 [Pavlovales sp. CCMP2436]|nr:hypothetical protein T492DRAFT_966530 [Pavlovales sp. CCMP2436]|mmetsp:Transcript_4600/g.12066  ORF Transcript_4600/g.12066 Transcript_4600/m.12066 type:complete len:139 (+) Transcript_4600:257-673(+)
MAVGFFANLSISGLILSYALFLLIGGVWAAATTGAIHTFYGGLVSGTVVLFCAFLASWEDDKKCVAAGVHIDLMLAACFTLVFARLTYKSSEPVLKMDRFPLFVIFTLGSACHVVAMLLKKPRKAARPLPTGQAHKQQ